MFKQEFCFATIGLVLEADILSAAVDSLQISIVSPTEVVAFHNWGFFKMSKTK